jgi:hypothetical protein
VNREINLKALEMATPLGKHPNILVDTHGEDRRPRETFRLSVTPEE